MKSSGCILWLALLLSGCSVLNFQDEPKVQENCHYADAQGIEFQFNQLKEFELNEGFKHIFVAPSKQSATLSAQYQGTKGKLVGNVIERHYPKYYFWGHRPSPFRDSLLYDDGYEDLYLTSKQKEQRDRKTKYVSHQAILENCKIVYILVDSLAQDLDNPVLIEQANLKIIN